MCFVCFLYIQTMYKLYEISANVNRIIYTAVDVVHTISGNDQ